MGKSLKKRVQRLEAQVETLAKKVQVLGRTGAKKKVSKRRVKVAGASPARKVKRAVVKRAVVKPAAVKPAALTSPSEIAPQSGAA